LRTRRRPFRVCLTSCCVTSFPHVGRVAQALFGIILALRHGRGPHSRATFARWDSHERLCAGFGFFSRRSLQLCYSISGIRVFLDYCAGVLKKIKQNGSCAHPRISPSRTARESGAPFTRELQVNTETGKGWATPPQNRKGVGQPSRLHVLSGRPIRLFNLRVLTTPSIF